MATEHAVKVPDKSASKSALKRVVGKPFSADDPRRGRGPKKGAPNAGRPPEAFGEFLAGVRKSPGFRGAITRAAENEESRAFGHVLKLAREYDPEAPERKVSVQAQTTLTIRVEYGAPMGSTAAPQSIGSGAWSEL